MTYPIQPSFTGGELSPSLYARVDLAKYAIGAKTMLNFLCHPHGGVSNRAGTYYIGEVADSTKEHRLIPFQFSVTQSYMLEFGDNTMRVIKDSGYVLDGTSVSAYEISTPYGEDDISAIMYAQTADTMYLAHGSYPPQVLTRLDHDDWTMTETSFTDGPYLAYQDGDSDYSFTPSVRAVGATGTMTCSASFFNSNMVGSYFRLGYEDAENPSDIDWGHVTIDGYNFPTEVTITVVTALGFDYTVNGDFVSGENNWEDKSTGNGTLSVVGGVAVLNEVAGSDVAAMQQAMAVPDGASLTLSVTTGDTLANNLRILAGSTEGGSQFAAFSATNTGTTYTSTFTATTDLVYVKIYTNGSSTGDSKVSLVELTTANLSTANWRESAFTAEHGYPATVAFFEQRLLFGGTSGYPQTIWCSKTAEYTNFGFTTPLVASDAFSFTLDSMQMNAIRWMFPMQELVVGTAGAEYKISGGSSSDSMTPTSILARVQSRNGSSLLLPEVVNYTLVYLQRGGALVRDFSYSDTEAQYVGINLSIIAQHLFTGYTIVDWAYAELPDSVLWCVRSDGTLLGFTYMREHDVWGWHQHTTDGLFESVGVIPGDTQDDEVYFVIKRTINGSDVRYVEKLMPRITDTGTYDYFFVDSGLTYTGVATTTLTGLDHLEGETVVALANGTVIEDLVVSGGSVTLSETTTLAHVGLPYISDLETLNINFSDDQGTSQGRRKVIPSITVRFQETRALWAGPDSSHLVEIPFRTNAMDESPIPLYTGDKQVKLKAGYDTNGRLLLRNIDPVPVTILGVIPDVEISDI